MRVSSRPAASRISSDHGFLTSRTLPNALVYVTALSVDCARHDRSLGTGPASISSSPSRIESIGTARVEKRSRTVRALTKSIANGSDGSRSYSVPGNSFPGARDSPGSSFSKLKLGTRAYRSHCSIPRPVVGSNRVTRAATKYSGSRRWKSSATSTGSPNNDCAAAGDAARESTAARNRMRVMVTCASEVEGGAPWRPPLLEVWIANHANSREFA